MRDFYHSDRWVLGVGESDFHPDGRLGGRSSSSSSVIGRCSMENMAPTPQRRGALLRFRILLI